MALRDEDTDVCVRGAGGEGAPVADDRIAIDGDEDTTQRRGPFDDTAIREGVVGRHREP
jgi:hypothetical protein